MQFIGKEWTKVGLLQYELKKLLESCTNEELDQLLIIAEREEIKYHDKIKTVRESRQNMVNPFKSHEGKNKNSSSS